MSTKPKIDLTKEDGNSFAILAKVKKALENEGLFGQAQSYLNEATTSDYNNLLRVTLKYIDLA